MTRDYSEPSQSTVVLPDPPAWLKLDGVLPYDDRERLKDVIEHGRELLPDLAEWARNARAAHELLHELPVEIFEVDALCDCVGITALDDLMFLMGSIGGNPAGTPGSEQREALKAQYPDYSDLIDPL